MSATETDPKPQDAVDVLEPKAANRTVTIGVDPMKMTYVQRPMSFFQKLEVFSLLGSALDQAMAGPDGLTLGEIFEGPSGLGASLSDENYQDADTFVRAIAKLVQYVPDLLQDLYVVVLGVPRGDRELVKDMMERPEDEGGLSDEDGMGILDTFVDQNWEAMTDFFGQRIMPLFNKINSKVQGSAPSKPSKTTRRTTRKQQTNS